MSSFFTGQDKTSARLPDDPCLRERDERLESYKAVIGKLAHDFNNFLVPVLGYVALIKEEISEDSGANPYAITLESAARKTEEYLDSILLGMRPQRHFSPKEFNFSDLVSTLVNDWKKSLPEMSQIEVLEDLAPITLKGDESHWRKALNALLSNARFALATGGTLTVTLTHETLSDNEMSQLGLVTGDVAKLSIRDTGFGMGAETLRRAFEPFFTTRTGTKAAGLGLTIVHSVAHLQGGQVTLESSEDKGSHIALYIPRIPPVNHHAELMMSHGSKEAKSPTKILLVESDPLVREVVKGTLAKTGHEVYVAQDAKEGLKFFNRYKTEWALVVSDIAIQGLDGIELWRKIHALAPDLPYIFLSGDTKFTPAGLGLEAGIQPPVLIRKPFTLKSLSEVVRTVVD